MNISVTSLEKLDRQTWRSIKVLERMLEPVGDGLFAYDRELRYLFWSRGMERLTGVRSQKVVGRSALELFPFLADTGEHSSLDKVIAGESVAVRDRSYAVPETQRVGYFDAHHSPLETADGRILGGMAILRDTSERKQCEAALRETEIQLEAFFDAPAMLWMSRTDSICTFFNRAWMDFTGRSIEEEWGVGWAEGIHPEDFQPAMDTYIAAFNKQRPFEMEYRLQRRDGEYRWFLDRGVPRYTLDGDFIGYIGVGVDIADRKKIEADLREAVRVRDEFLSIAAHELRTPITSLQLQLQMFCHPKFKEHAELNAERLRRIIEISERQVGKLTELINSLLEVSRIQAGTLPLQLDEVELAGLVQEIVERLSDQLARAGCQVEMRLQNGIVGHWDRFRLDQVLVNLLGNAARYAAGSMIEITARTQGAHAILTVRDEGPGIAAEELALIFERFHRSASSDHYGGLGLGLYIVAHIVHSHGGTIHAESEPAKGTSFIIDLPLIPPCRI